jgi:hypothetical protein
MSVIIPPGVLRFSGTRHALWNALIVGVLVIIFAAWDRGTMQQAGGTIIGARPSPGVSS